MTYAKKRTPLNFTIEPELKDRLKSYLKTINEPEDAKYTSQSEFISKAIELLLNKRGT